MSPGKPTRDRATGAEKPGEMYAPREERRRPDEILPEDRRAAGEGREEVGDSASSSEHPPHPTEGTERARVQGERGRGEAPVLPANAQGTDQVSSEEQALPIDDESMYDRRPAEDKDRPPSTEQGR